MSALIAAAVLAGAVPRPGSAKQVLEEYLKLESAGGRLTTGGWYSASRYLAKPQPVPHEIVVDVITGTSAAYPFTNFDGGKTRAMFGVECELIGTIDIEATFMNAVMQHPRDRMVFDEKDPEFTPPMLMRRQYELVFTDTYLEFVPGTKTLRPVTGPPQWKIVLYDNRIWVSPDGAMRYLGDLRDHSASPTIRRNAERSIAALRRMPRHYPHQTTAPASTKPPSDH